MPLEVDVKQMLEAGVHFGHQTRKWNPKMRPYIYTERDGVHIIDLAQTAGQVARAYKFIADTDALGNSVVFVGTKKQTCDVVSAEAQRAKQHYVNNRWLGGMLTNFKTVKVSIKRLKEMEVIPGRSVPLIFNRAGSIVYWERIGSAGFSVFCPILSPASLVFEDLFDQLDVLIEMIPLCFILILEVDIDIPHSKGSSVTLVCFPNLDYVSGCLKQLHDRLNTEDRTTGARSCH